ncbi:tetratricopeptide repeat protein [Mesorhizobium sp. B2-5-4]|uniref:toll/interleukin-1 receptor domain-containing protein n=1 Tax=Mesorhizobium sp. B2-5-4 TaxID=2589926 RepID=UPI00112A1CC0|nr:toll/interleukin-1 receptor domain-containing protein [Mesorhizobium sp. B2-5-4]TPK39236.1 tetratricopeptide repeat protein [Mesorhizobium sp. B2-5-4]
MKAFLSHSTVDRSFVSEVAKSLHREFVTYQEFSFDHGEAFRDEILRGLDKSAIFVLFISRSSLDSFWVNFELDQAGERLLEKKLAKAVGVRIDASVGFDELPSWLRSVNTPLLEHPAAAARMIRDHINRVKSESVPDLFIGRGRSLEQVEERMTPADHRPPGVVALWGLPGIGRRTLARRVVQNVLDFRRAVQIKVEPGDTAADLRVKIAAQYNEVKNPESYEQEQTQADSSTVEDNISAIVEYLSIAQANREAIILVDHGGMLDDEGAFYQEIQDLVRAVFLSVDQRMILISRRKPEQILLEPGLLLPTVKLERLSEDGTKTLIRQLAGRERFDMTMQEIDTLSSRVKGYPPAAYYVVELVKEYGKDMVLRNGRFLIEYREGAFLRLLEKDSKFSNIQKSILSILPQFEELPLSVIGNALDIDHNDLDSEMMRLVDLAIVSVSMNGYYSVADPIQEVTHKVFGKLNIPFARIADEIDSFLNDRAAGDTYGGDIPLSLVRARYKSYVLAGRNRAGLFHMVSDLTNVQQELYHGQDYQRSIEIGLQALDMRPDHLDILKFLARAYTQLEMYTDAQPLIELVKKKSMKEARFLEGFLQRKRGDTKAAAARYKEAIALGMRGAAVHRELGQCLYEENDFKGAAAHLQRAHEADPDNKYVIDFEVKVAVAEERFEDALALLDKLSKVEDESRVEHRRSTILLGQGKLEEAFLAARQALDLNRHPQFEMITQFITTAIRTRKFEDAQAGFEQLSHRFKGIRSDIQNGLWARYFLAKGEPEEAYNFWQKILEKGTSVHRRIGDDILQELVRLPGLKLSRKEELETMLKHLRG